MNNVTIVSHSFSLISTRKAAQKFINKCFRHRQRHFQFFSAKTFYFKSSNLFINEPWARKTHIKWNKIRTNGQLKREMLYNRFMYTFQLVKWNGMCKNKKKIIRFSKSYSMYFWDHNLEEERLMHLCKNRHLFEKLSVFNTD